MSVQGDERTTNIWGLTEANFCCQLSAAVMLLGE